MVGFNNFYLFYWILVIRKVEILDKRKMKEIMCLEGI